MPGRRRRVGHQELRHALQHVREREVGDRVDRAPARLRGGGEKAEAQLRVVAHGVQHGLAREQHDRALGERLGARRGAAAVEGPGLVERVVRQALAEGVRLAVGREQRETTFPLRTNARYGQISPSSKIVSPVL